MLKLNLIIGWALFLASCTSMTPVQVNNTLPTLTKSKFISQSQAEGALKTNGCKYLVKGRNYVAPIGLTTKNDLKTLCYVNKWQLNLRDAFARIKLVLVKIRLFFMLALLQVFKGIELALQKTV